MKRVLVFLGVLALHAQTPPDPATADLLRERFERIGIRVTNADLADPTEVNRLALRAPLLAPPTVPLPDLQSVQTGLIRLADRQPLPIGTTPNPFPVLLPPPSRRIPSATPNVALGKPTRQSSVRLLNSRGGVDGLGSGTFGFDTEQQSNPWWQVDLERRHIISQILVYNHRVFPERARHLHVLVSADGQTWRTIYSHNGTVFGAEGLPLRIPVKQEAARFVRIQLPGTGYLNLEEVEIFGAVFP